MNNKIPQTDYDIEEVLLKIKDIAEFHGVILSGKVDFYNEVIATHYVIDTENRVFYPKIIATTDVPQQIKKGDCN
jgi:hypothetical protein|uniref:Uncharacterized protein n=1 Tax=Siphoviridae sp. ctwQT14 TaxID=2827971 RepID=A0A8S5TJW0_9CAUD|nr:MAG TPA: hypothetical protein [Siphoviridae sp. ctwQT14]